MHIHLDLTGGIAGDMFSAALLDMMPELEHPLLSMLKDLQLDTNVQVTITPASDKGLNGKRFNVALSASPKHHVHNHEHHDHTHEHHDHGHEHHDHSHQHHDHSHEHHDHSHEHHDNTHGHHDWKTIRSFITNSQLEEDVKKHALGIFGLLAAAEAKVHNMELENVKFHEVGAWDCIVDIISASWLICHSKTQSWSVSDLPWGGGTVRCAHGDIPVPAPATVNLLKGFSFIDDGIKGERITPTGAAILAWISPSQKVTTGTLNASGYGFGTRKLPGRANVLRASLITPQSATKTEEITTIQCDIDDMTSEMLAIAREKIRKLSCVLEITEAISHGKKNRFISTPTRLCEPLHTQQAIMPC